MIVLAALGAALAATVVPGGPGAPRAAAQVETPDGEQVDYAPPVDAPITDPFRPPPRPWLPGNRGIEFATVPGTPVRAAGRGRVAFAGPVAGALHVTVAHPDGVRTSYSFLASVAVVVGADVVRGQVVGTAGRRLHVGARRGDTYIDPASLWGATGPPWVRLAPLDGAGAPPGRRVGGVRGVAT
jgi:murein DD-endopeptidase MepM/ murein hydrolase activator NlpD